MKRTGNLIESIADPENLRLAFWKAQKGKSHRLEVMMYQSDLDNHLLGLREQLLSGKVEVGDYHYFKVYDPKERQICASAFPERVLHHALMNCCHSSFDRYQIDDSYASRPGKGLHAAMKRAAKYSNTNKWFLKLDVRKYFSSISHKVLQLQLKKRFKDPKLLAIFDQIIASYADTPGKGVPIGNLASQYFANHYLAGLDHWIKENLQVKAYIRYMDDMVLWHVSKAELKIALRSIEDYVKRELKLSLKPPLLNSVSRGVPFCGYVFRPGNIRLAQRSKRRYIRKLNFLQQQYAAGNWSAAECQRKVLPLIAFTQHADARSFRKAVLGKINGHLP